MTFEECVSCENKIPLRLISFLKNLKSFNRFLDDCNPLTLFDGKLRLELFNNSSFYLIPQVLYLTMSKRHIKCFKPNFNDRTI